MTHFRPHIERLEGRRLLAADPSWIGMNAGVNESSPIADVISDLDTIGIEFIRGGGNAGPGQSQALADQDAVVNAYHNAGYRIHWSINYRGNGVDRDANNQTLDTDQTGNGNVESYADDDPVKFDQWLTQYEDRVRFIMERYRGKIDYYIVGNEPDKLDPFTGRLGASQAVDFTRAAFDAAADVNATYGTDIKVESAPVASPDTGYLRRMIQDHDVHLYSDFLGIHAYGGQLVDGRLNKPWQWLASEGASMPVAISEIGVKKQWVDQFPSITYQGTPDEWTVDFLASAYVQSKASGVDNAIFFNRRDQPTGWGLIRDESGSIRNATFDALRDNFDADRGLVNGGFEAVNDFRYDWVPVRNPDDPWPLADFDFDDSRERSGSNALEIKVGQAGENRAVRQVVGGLLPGVPYEITAYARAEGNTTARLTAHGYDRTNGDAFTRATTTSSSYTKVSVTVTPTNPWVVIELAGTGSNNPSDDVRFDDVNIRRAAVPLVGRHEAEDYDAFFDTTAGNNGGAYRQDDVDIQATSDVGGGFNVGWISDGEYLDFPVSVTPGTYDLKLRVAAQNPSASREAVLRLDGDEIGRVVIPSTGGWQNWSTVTIPAASLNVSGERTLRLESAGNSWNVNWLEVSPLLKSGVASTFSIQRLTTFISLFESSPTRINASIPWSTLRI
ncbi:MAG: carbohydrate-binding domain-containing protein [Planctomycetota bacterium]